MEILTYHSIDESGSVISTSLKKFRSQLQHLADRAYHVVPLTWVAGQIRERIDFPAKTVAITFDDGYRSFYDTAFPILREFGFSATVFVVTGRCGKDNRWEGQPARIPSMDLLSWEQVLELSENRIDFGSHSISHPDLSRMSVDAAEKEIADSLKMIQDRTGKKSGLFCYPYGRYNASVRSIIARHYQAACSTELDVVSSESDVYSLPRIDMYYFSRNELFQRLGTPFVRRYLRYRKFLRTLKNQ